jgi:transaldolase
MKTGQSIWFDNIKRSMLTGGELARYVAEDDLRGVTSNPSIFEKAINGSEDYDDQMRALIEKGLEIKDIYEALVIDDIRGAADILRPAYDKTGGIDGYISLEVDPRLAYDTSHTIDEASRLFKAVDRPNVMIKIPAAQEGLPAIAESIHRGVNINVTMIFSIENYEQVADAFITGLERRASEGKPVEGIASVASFFVSRVDTAVDKQLDGLAASAQGAKKDELLALRGQAAVANAKLAYRKFKEIFHKDERFAKLRGKGAQVQRCLWASTGTKNPDYSDILYVDTLIGPETVNTIPPQTYDAFKDHGKVSLTLEEGLDEAAALIAELGDHGVDMDAVTAKLQKDGLDAFVSSFDTLLDAISAKRDALVSGAKN